MAFLSRIRNFTQRLFFQWRYFGSPPWDTGISPPELIAFIQSHLAGRALDLGCGTGTNAITLARAGWEVIGVDFIGSAIKEGRKKAQQAGVKVDLREGDVTHLENIAGPFDLVLDIGCFHNLTQPGKTAYLKQLVKLLAPQGVFLLYGFIASVESDKRGIKTEDLASMAQLLELIERVDGMDRTRNSAWFSYRLKP